MPAHQDPEGTFGAPLFCLIVILISCIRPLLYLALWNSPCVTRRFGCWPQRLTHGTGYKRIWPLCQKHVTRPVNNPANLCILIHFCCNLRRWSSGSETAPQCDNTVTHYPGLLHWAFDHSLFPQLPLTARLGLGIQQHLTHNSRINLYKNFKTGN
jgi:hypothetical protein